MSKKELEYQKIGDFYLPKVFFSCRRWKNRKYRQIWTIKIRVFERT